MILNKNNTLLDYENVFTDVATKLIKKAFIYK